MAASPSEDTFLDIQKLLRRGSAPLLLAFGLAAAPAGAPHAESPPEPSLIASQGQSLSDSEWQRRDGIRRTLLAAAIQKYGPLSDTTIMHYSSHLSDLQQRINSYLTREEGAAAQAIILDPHKVDMGLAFGVAVPDSIEALLAKSGVKVGDMTFFSITQSMHMAAKNPFGAYTYTQQPQVILDAHIHQLPVCLVIPASDHLNLLDIKGLTQGEEARFINLHEAWHCKDPQHKLTTEGRAAINHFGIHSYDPAKENRDLHRAFATVYNQEALADAGSIGDFIREGGSADILAHVKAFRESRPGDFLHLSSPVLALLSKRLEEMGLERFRALDDSAARAFYLGIVAQEGMNETSMRATLQYLIANPFRQFGYRIEGLSNPDIAKGVRLARYLHDESNQRPAAPAASITEEERKAVQDWNASTALQDHAFAASGKITPVTLTEAYARMRNHLRDQMAMHPQSSLPPAWTVKLKESYKMIWQIDYVEANARRGVDIEKAEAELFTAQNLTPVPVAPASKR